MFHIFISTHLNITHCIGPMFLVSVPEGGNKPLIAAPVRTFHLHQILTLCYCWLFKHLVSLCIYQSLLIQIDENKEVKI